MTINCPLKSQDRDRPTTASPQLILCLPEVIPLVFSGVITTLKCLSCRLSFIICFNNFAGDMSIQCSFPHCQSVNTHWLFIWIPYSLEILIVLKSCRPEASLHDAQTAWSFLYNYQQLPLPLWRLLTGGQLTCPVWLTRCLELSDEPVRSLRRSHGRGQETELADTGGYGVEDFMFQGCLIPFPAVSNRFRSGLHT